MAGATLAIRESMSALGLRHRAGVHAGKPWMPLIDDAFFHQRCNEGTTERFDRLQLKERGFGIILSLERQIRQVGTCCMVSRES